MSLGLFIPGRSPLHRLSARVKVLGLAIAGVGLFLLSNGVILGVLLLGAMGLLAIARIPASVVWQQVRPLLPVLVGILLVHGLFTSWYTGMVIVLRFAVLILLALAVSLTTRVAEMMAVVEGALRPLARVGVNPAQVSMMVAIAIRFIPVLLDQARQIQDAQRARGLERHWMAFLVPLLIRTLRLADELSEALTARGYEGEE
jgi:biotin transport system permease protein